MVDTYQVVLGAIAVSIMVLIPIFCMFVWDLLAGRWDASIKRWREKRAADAAHRKGVRALKTQQGIPIEQLAADLRRLRALLGKDEHRSAAHQIGNRLAYDRLMIQICEMLDIEHELGGDSIGVERDIERFRVEAELERAGVVLTDRRYGQAA
jgi:ABC-type phosphate transport system auxiliary subunit